LANFGELLRKTFLLWRNLIGLGYWILSLFYQLISIFSHVYTPTTVNYCIQIPFHTIRNSMYDVQHRNQEVHAHNQYSTVVVAFIRVSVWTRAIDVRNDEWVVLRALDLASWSG
jgi:hypothetical protein